MVTTFGVTVHWLPKIFFVPSTILDVVVCLHSPQTEVCPLCVRACILPDMTLGVAIRPESVSYVLGPAQHDPRHNRLSSQSSNQSLSAACQDCSLVDCFYGSLLVFFRRSHPFFLLWFCILDYMPPKFKIHNMSF